MANSIEHIIHFLLTTEELFNLCWNYVEQWILVELNQLSFLWINEWETYMGLFPFRLRIQTNEFVCLTLRALNFHMILSKIESITYRILLRFCKESLIEYFWELNWSLIWNFLTASDANHMFGPCLKEHFSSFLWVTWRYKYNLCRSVKTIGN